MEAPSSHRPGHTGRYDDPDPATAPQYVGGRPLRVVQWNIERGRYYGAMESRLRELDADVLCLQELDVGCRRSDFVDVPQRLCRSLRMTTLFAVEFEELDSPVRSEINAAGPSAYHGNAIMTRLPVLDYGFQHHSTGVSWSEYGDVVDEPRRGARGVQWAKLKRARNLVSSELSSSLTQKVSVLHVYNLHLEIFAGAGTRLRQFLDVLRLAKQHYDEMPPTPLEHYECVICGDFNTIGHGIVRFSANCARDMWRALIWGETEGEWFARHVLKPTPAGRLWSLLVGLSREEERLLQFGKHVLQLADPFDVYEDVTFFHPKYRGLVQGKLDWLIASAATLDIREEQRFNRDYTESDHAGLVAVLHEVEERPRKRYSVLVREGPLAARRYRQASWRCYYLWGCRLVWWVVAVILATMMKTLSWTPFGTSR